MTPVRKGQSKPSAGSYLYLISITEGRSASDICAKDWTLGRPCGGEGHAVTRLESINISGEAENRCMGHPVRYWSCMVGSRPGVSK
jgi:hypothetical protein